MWSLLIPLLSLPLSPREAYDRPETVPGLVLVKVAPAGLSELEVHLEGRAVALERALPEPRGRDQVGLARIYSVRVAVGSEGGLSDELRAQPWVEWAEPCGRAGGVTGAIFPNDPFFASQWHLHQTNDVDMDLPEAWDLLGGTDVGGGLLVAVIDTGFELPVGTPEFAGTTWTNPGELRNGQDDDGNGLVDDLNGYDFAYGDADPDDLFGHGVPVSGILAARPDNGFEVAGIAPDLRLMHLKAFDDTGDFPLGGPWPGHLSAAAALEYAVDNGAQLINNSWWNGTSSSQVINDAIQYAQDNGVHLVFAAANDNLTDAWPCQLDGLIAVAGIDSNGVKASFSNWGAWVDVAAAAENVVTNYIGSVGPVFFSGTSAAAPCVTGVVALLLTRDADLGSEDLRRILMEGAVDVDAANPGWAGLLGAGHVNALGSLQLLEGVADLGQATSGNHAPVLNAWGSTGLGGQLTWSLSGAGANELGVFLFGASRVDLPLLGGVLVPFPNVLVPVAADADGAHSLAHTLSKALPSGPALWTQYAGIDLGAPQGISFSNAVVFSGP